MPHGEYNFFVHYFLTLELHSFFITSQLNLTIFLFIISVSLVLWLLLKRNIFFNCSLISFEILIILSWLPSISSLPFCCFSWDPFDFFYSLVLHVNYVHLRKGIFMIYSIPSSSFLPYSTSSLLHWSIHSDNYFALIVPFPSNKWRLLLLLFVMIK